MKYRSHIFAEARGSVGGITYSRNAFGLYTRSRATPVNPATNFQEIVRTLFAGLPVVWSSVLTNAQRSGWRSYALNVSIPDPLGEPIHLSGLNHFIRSNVPRLQAGMDRIDDAPAGYDLGYLTPPVPTVSEAAGEVSIAFDVDDEWATTTEGALFVYASRPINASRIYFTGPYRYAGRILGDSVTPPTSPQAFDLPFAAAAGQQVGVKLSAGMADGRLTAPFRQLTVVAA